MRTMLGLVLGGLLGAGSAAAQESPLVPPELYERLNGELSGDISYDHVRHLTLYHSPNGASRGFREKMKWIAERARAFGLEDVRILDDLRYRGVGWSPVSAELWIVRPDARRLISLEEAAVAIADYSRSGTWEGELVDAGTGTRDADYEGRDVKGKIVLASGSPSAVMEQAVWKRGALGIVSYNTARGIDHPDQVAWIRLNPRPPEGKQNTFAFSISNRAGLELRQRLAPRPKPGAVPGTFEETTLPGETIVVRARVEAEFEENARQWIVEGWIRGTQEHDPAIVLTAHAQEEKFSANDDNSGCANLLEIGRALAKLIREGSLPRPRRDLRFWWTNEIDAEYEYFAAHPEERSRILLNLNQDMVGAKQSMGSRVQLISRTPWSRPSYLNTAVESIATLVMRGNTAYLAAGQAGTPQPYGRAIVSHLGTRERYAAEIVPHFNNTDHMVFNDGIIGIPGVTLTNWPDPFIHSSDDDLGQLDATQLKRNAFVVAATAWYFAALEPQRVGPLAAQVHASVRRMLAEAMARATEIVALAPAAGQEAAFFDGVNLIEQSVARGLATVRSLEALDPAGARDGRVPWGLVSLAGDAASELEEFANAYRMITGKAAPSEEKLSDEEQAMKKKVPEVAASVREYLEKRRTIRNAAPGLHPVMAYEVWNFVDGRRSAFDIYRAVKAEAQSAGAWYYGRVSAKDVADLLDRGVKAGILRLKP